MRSCADGGASDGKRSPPALPGRSRGNSCRLNSKPSARPEPLQLRSLPPACNCHAKEEGDEQTGQGRFARDCRDRRERPAGLSSFVDDMRQAVDSGAQASRDLSDRVGDVGRRVDGALGHAGLGLRNLGAQIRKLRF